MFNIGGTKKTVLNNIFWSTLGRIVRVGTETLVGIFVARYLGPAQYGLMNYVISLVTIFSIFAAFGLDNVEIRELSKQKDAEEILGTSFSIRIVSSLIAIFSIVVLLLINDTDKNTATLILIYSFSVILSSFNVIRNYFTSILQNKYIVLSEISRCVIGACIKVILLLTNASLIWFIVALTFDFALVASGYIISYKKKVCRHFKWHYNSQKAKYLIKESFPLLLSGAAVIVYQRIDQVIINSLINSDAVGYFSAAAKFSEFILFVPLVMAQTISPVLVKTRENNIEKYREYRQKFSDIVVWVSVFMAVLLSFCSSFIIKFTYGIQYLPSITVLQIMAFKTIGMALSNTSGQLIIIEGKQKYAVIRNIFGCLFCVIGNYLLIPNYGIEGSAFATIITVLVSGFLVNFLITPYRNIFYIQVKSITSGPIRIFNYFHTYVHKN